MLANMGKKLSLSEVERAQVVVLHQEGFSERAISKKLKRGKTAVHNAVVKLANSGTYSDRQRSGLPRKTRSRDEHATRRITVQSPMSSSRKTRSILLSKGTAVSRRTVSRRLIKEFG